jgi:WxL domain surface cell wall-binding
MRRISRRALRPATAAIMLLALATPVLGVNIVTQQITAGTRSASIADVTLGALVYSHSDQTNTGTLVLTADDSTGSLLGWNVTVQASAFSSGGNTIPAANFSITSAGAATRVVGQAVDAVGGPKAPATGATGSLDVARKTLQALPLFGAGTYTQNLGVSLLVPGGTPTGTYTSTLTVTISAGP